MSSAKTHHHEELAVQLLSKDKQLLAREPVLSSDLLSARDETWLYGLRAGTLGTDLAALEMHVWPGENRGADRLAGYVIELREGHRSFRRQFSLTSLEAVARRATPRLVEQGLLDPLAEFTYCLTALPPSVEERGQGRDSEASPPVDSGLKVTHRVAPPVFEPARLAEYLENSEPLIGPSTPRDEGPEMPVFISPEVWQQGHELARRGGEQESAAVWTGRLMGDTDSPEKFMLLDACIEAEHAAEEKYAVTFSGDTWAKVREVLEQRRRRLNRPQERICASVHGHNFLPEPDAHGRRTCEICHLPSTVRCSRTTSQASVADLDWHRSIFTTQPWAVLCVWGWNAREQEEWTLYGLADATLAPRSLRLLKA